MAGTPGMYPPAGTPSMYAAAGTPGMYGADMQAPTPGGGQYGGAPPPPPSAAYQHWVDVEVVLPGGERGAVRAVDGGAATVALGRQEGEQQWAYPPDAPTRQVPVGDMQLVALGGWKGSIRVVAGELAGQYGELVGTDGGDGIIKLGSDLKIIALAELGRLAVQPEQQAAAGGAPPPPPA